MIGRPGSSEYAPFYAGYVAEAGTAEAGTADPLVLMRAQLDGIPALLAGVGESRGGHRYAEGKWSIREVVGHLADVERIMAYRALRLARADSTPLPGFEEDDYVAAGSFERRTLAALIDEWQSVRRGTITLFGGLPAEALERRGTVNNGPMSVRALAWIIAGHAHHHVTVLRTRYGIGGE